MTGFIVIDVKSQEPLFLCAIYNSDFLIYSSMGSFYIPCIVMTLLYWRIFRRYWPPPDTGWKERLRND